MSASPALDEDIAAVRADIENNERASLVSNARILRILAHVERLETAIRDADDCLIELNLYDVARANRTTLEARTILRKALEPS